MIVEIRTYCLALYFNCTVFAITVCHIYNLYIFFVVHAFNFKKPQYLIRVVYHYDNQILLQCWMIFTALTTFCCTLSANGSYIYIESSFPRKPNDTAKLISSIVPGTTAYGGKCLSFWYHMYGAHISTLSVYLRNGSHDTLLWSKAGTRGNKWLEAVVTVNSSTNFQVKLAIFNFWQKKINNKY